jgi:dUTP pyrophosphatase
MMAKITREWTRILSERASKQEARTDSIAETVERIAQSCPDSQMVVFAPAAEGEPWSAPTRAHKYDAGIDLRISKGVNLSQGASAMVPTGTSVRIPQGYFGMIAIRSGLGAKGIALLNGVGIIDHGYEGEIKLILANFGSEDWSAAPGDRVAQLIVVPCVPGPEVSFGRPLVSSSERGEGGFGSTGMD